MDPFLGAFLGIAGLLAAAACAQYPRLLLAVTALAVLFTPTLAVVSGIGQVSLIDDALVLGTFLYMPARRLIAGHQLRRLPGGRWFCAVLVVGALGSLVQDVPASIALSGAFLLAKGAMLGFAFAQEEWSVRDVHRIGRALRGFLVFLIGCAMVNLLVPGPWSEIFASSGVADFRGPIPSIIGPFTVPSFMGQIVGMCVIAVLILGREVGGLSRSLAATGFVVALLTFRRKTWVSLPVALASVLGIRHKGALAIFGLPALVVGLIIAWGPITETIDDSRFEYFERAAPAPRVLMYRGAVELANEHPLGAGLGRWGSSAALTNYSPEYYERGFQNLDGLAPDSKNNYATDTFWPIPLGETGWPGALLYAGGLVAIWRFFRRAIREGSSATRAVGMVGTGWMVMLLIESSAAPVFTGPPIYPWLFVAVGIAAALLDGQERQGQGDGVHDPEVVAEVREGRAGRLFRRQ
jgi:hypothetical protein